MASVFPRPGRALDTVPISGSIIVRVKRAGLGSGVGRKSRPADAFLGFASGAWFGTPATGTLKPLAKPTLETKSRLEPGRARRIALLKRRFPQHWCTSMLVPSSQEFVRIEANDANLGSDVRRASTLTSQLSANDRMTIDSDTSDDSPAPHSGENVGCDALRDAGVDDPWEANDGDTINGLPHGGHGNLD